jgi:hypothetical protein
MKLTKKQLSASYVTQATAATVGIHTGDVANHGDYRLDSRPVASLPRQGRVHHTRQLRITSRERVWSPYQVEIDPRA